MRMLISLLTSFMLFMSTAYAEEHEEQMIQDVISKQLSAFLNNDGRAAWAHAHPAIKAQFNTPDKFMAMVARGYAPLMSFVELNFVELEKFDDQWVQTLLLRDTSGQLYELFYSLMEVQPGRFQITGVYLEAYTGI